MGHVVSLFLRFYHRIATYTYTDAWGNHSVSYSNGGASTGAAYNPFRYRGYYYDTDLGMYYLQSRYYDPNTCRFINADGVSYLGANGDLTGYNLYAYSSNNPVNFVDPSGHAIESIWDIISLAMSVMEVASNPYDVWAWAGLAGDLIDLIPFVTGVGEATDLLRLALLGSNVMETADDIHDAARALGQVGEAIELHRPYIRKSTREAVEAAAQKTVDGKFFLDANTGEIIYGKYDLGHAFGHEYWREKQIAMSKGWTQKQFNDYMNDPSFYRIELPHNNRSHRFEMPR